MFSLSIGEGGAYFWKGQGTCYLSPETYATYPDVWEILKEDGQINWVAFGPNGYYFCETPLRRRASRISDLLRTDATGHTIPVRSASFGYGGSWVVIEDIGGTIRSHGLSAEVRKATLQAEIRNIQLSQVNPEHYYIEYMDGTIDWSLPPSWHDDVRRVEGGLRKPKPALTVELEALRNTEEDYISLEHKFRTAWKGDRSRDVETIYTIRYGQEMSERYQSYLHRAKPELLLFHGTTRKCTIGDPGTGGALCFEAGCSMCAILRTSFNVKYASDKGKLGLGIYCSGTASKANHYSKNGINSEYKAMILSRVAVGKIHYTDIIDKGRKAPPPGFGSVCGLPDSELNDDETVVYDDDAIRPAYLIIYEHFDDKFNTHPSRFLIRSSHFSSDVPEILFGGGHSKISDGINQSSASLSTLNGTPDSAKADCNTSNTPSSFTLGQSAFVFGSAHQNSLDDAKVDTKQSPPLSNGTSYTTVDRNNAEAGPSSFTTEVTPSLGDTEPIQQTAAHITTKVDIRENIQSLPFPFSNILNSTDDNREGTTRPSLHNLGTSSFFFGSAHRNSEDDAKVYASPSSFISCPLKPPYGGAGEDTEADTRVESPTPLDEPFPSSPNSPDRSTRDNTHTDTEPSLFDLGSSLSSFSIATHNTIDDPVDANTPSLNSSASKLFFGSAPRASDDDSRVKNELSPFKSEPSLVNSTPWSMKDDKINTSTLLLFSNGSSPSVFSTGYSVQSPARKTARASPSPNAGVFPSPVITPRDMTDDSTSVGPPSPNPFGTRPLQTGILPIQASNLPQKGAPESIPLPDIITYEPIQINNYNLAELKNTLDDAVKRCLSRPDYYTQNHMHTDVRLALGYTAVLIAAATGFYSWKISFEESKMGVMAGVSLYMLLSAGQMLYAYFVEGNTVFVGKRKVLAKRIETERLIAQSRTTHPKPSASSPAQLVPSSILSTVYPRSTSPYLPPHYKLALQYMRTTSGGKTHIRNGKVEDERCYADFFDENGSLDESRLAAWVLALVQNVETAQ
ncbi:hypothetical protein FRB97_008605 [Tulasnella sp. 331]|nr:hypothetical protein FRB97_008605 [Tulasnella sp. 331]